MKTRIRELTESEKLKLADVDYFRHLFNVYPTGIVSIVSDTFDYWNTLTNTARVLKDDILRRGEADGTFSRVVFRPDTGDPVKVVVGEAYSLTPGDDVKERAKKLWLAGWQYVTHNGKYFKLTDTGVDILHIEEVPATPELKGSIEVLWDVFGGSVSEQGYKVLNPKVGLIYGDSITYERAQAICEGLKAKGFASTNIVFGIGSFTYQYNTRDTDGFAVKATFARVDGIDREIFKAPKTDDGTKKSAKGLTAVFKDANGKFYLKDQATWDDVLNCEFIPIYKDGVILKDYTLQEVRDTLTKYL